MNEDPEIYLTRGEVLKLPTHVKLAIVHHFPENWHIIRKATLELLTTGKSPHPRRVRSLRQANMEKTLYPLVSSQKSDGKGPA